MSGRRMLAGRADTYTDPAGAIGYQLVMLLRDYAKQGGDLECVQLTVTTDRLNPRRNRKGISVRLDGYEASRGSTSATTASSDS